jgi:hypothetical protein
LLGDSHNETKLTGWTDRSKFIVEALGTGESVAEIGEQLAWLGAALRSSPYEVGVAYCMPYISDVYVNNGLQPKSRLLPGTDVLFKIDFNVDSRDEVLKLSNGQCWHNMFRNPVVVKGYPIPRRSEAHTGLEIPLNMMAGLIRTQRIDSFNGKLYIKGFAAMLVPTKNCADLLIWHLLYNKDGTRISYLDNNSPHTENVSVLDLVHVRHVIGWCSEVRNYAGTKDV